ISIGSFITQSFNGSIDDVMIFNRTLTKEQILAIYNNETNKIVSQETSTGENWTVQIYPNDGIGDGLAKNSSIQVLDSQSPGIDLELPVDQANMSSSTINFNWTVTDDNASIVTCNFTLDGVINQTSFSVTTGQTSNYTIENITEGGSHLWNLTCFDANANLNISATYNFSVDLTVPNVTLDMPANWQNFSIQTVNFNFSVTDNISSSTTCDLYIDGAKNVSEMSVINGPTYNISVENITEGTHYWNISCRDDANNTNMSISRNFTIDSILPVPWLNAPANNFNMSTSTVRFNWTVTDNVDVSLGCDLVIDGVVNVSNISTTSGTLQNQDVVEFGEGAHLWNVTCRDSANNLNTSEMYNFTVDLTNPNVTLDTPVSKSNFSINTINFNFTVSDNIASSLTCDLYINGTLNVSDIVITSGLEYNITVQNLPDGFQNWNVSCRDDAGNTNMSVSNNFTVDTIFPLIDYTIGTQPNATPSNRNWIFVNVSVTEINIANITFNLYNGTAIVNSTNYSMATVLANVTFNWTNLQNATYFYNVTVRDAFGHVNSTIVRTIYLDAEGPNVTLTAPASYSQDFDKVVTFAYKVNDTLSPVSNCTLFINYTSNITNITIVQGVDQNFTVRQIPEWDNLSWYVTCYDNASNSGNSSVWFLDAFQNPTTSDSSSGDSGGGGGGGGGGAVSSASATVAYISEIVPDAPQSITFSKEQHSIREITLEVKENVANAQLRVEDLDSAPDDVDQIDNVYSFIEISATNLDVTNLDSAKILFRVSKSWFEENDFDNEDIYLFRFTNKNWRQLKTNIDSDDNDYYYYKAETSGFSTFAIAVSETLLIEEEDVVDEEIEEEFVDNGEELTRFEFNFKEVNDWWYVGAGVLILLLVTGIILWLVLRKKDVLKPNKKSKKKK
ncbi:MAG: PGF-pre-PGF domain-containing protein, partial [archaeon]